MKPRIAPSAALALAWAWLGCGAPEPPRHPDVFLFTIESLRPEHLGPYGAERDTTPNLDAFAEEAVVYDDAHAVTSWTLASHASMFTGLYPTAHGTRGPRSKLPDDEAVTLADLLSEAGYQTAGMASGPYLAKRHNLSQGFEYYDDSAATVGTQGGAHDDVTNPLLERVIARFLESYRDPRAPALPLRVLLGPPTTTTSRRRPSTRSSSRRTTRRSTCVATSRASASRARSAPRSSSTCSPSTTARSATRTSTSARLFDRLKAAGLWEDSVVIVTSDHGEEFFDHGGKGHKRNVYDESVRVPLVIKYPRAARTGRDARLVSLVDLFPTILDLAGVEPAAPHQGASLLDDAPDPDRSIFFELLSTFYHRKTDGPGFERRDEEWQGVRRGDHKLIRVPGADRTELYRVDVDRAEQHDVASVETERVAELRVELDAFLERSRRLGSGDAAPEAELDEAALERLRALGYLDREAGE